MKAYRKSLLILALFSSCVLVISCFPTRRRDKDQEELAGSFHQLANVQASIEAEIMRRRTSFAPIDLKQAVLQIVEEQRWGVTFFRCESDTNSWLRINADSTKWINTSNFWSEIAIFNPNRFYPAKTNVPVFAGITFGGQKVILSEYPKWKPLPVWEFKMAAPVE